jgi:hypothetical protein
VVPFSGIEDLGGLADMENDTVQVDFDGIESTGIGTDTEPITNPATIINNFMTNFVFNAWPDGATRSASGTILSWLDSSFSPFNSSHIAEAEAFYAARDSEASRVLRTTDRGITILNEFCFSEQCGPFWSWDWKLGLRPIPFANLEINNGRVIAPTDLAVRRAGDQVVLIAPRGSQRTQSLVSDITVNWFLDHAAGATRRKGRVSDSNRFPVLGEDITNNWIAGTIT